MKTQIAVYAACTILSSSGLAAAQAAPQPSPVATTAQPGDPTPAASVPPTSISSAPPAQVADRAAASPTTPPMRDGRAGFLMRLQLGGGYRSASSGLGSNALRVNGAGFGGSILIGGAVSPNLFLYGEFMEEVISDPTIEIGQKKVVANQASTHLYGFGPGIAYLMPRGIHFGGTLLMARMTVENDDQEVGATEIGYGFAARAGKDFWLTDHHALGIVGQFSFASMADKSTATEKPPTFTATSFTLALSGTYN